MNVRELVALVKFKTDNASAKSAENAVTRIKTMMQKVKPLTVKMNTGTATKNLNRLQTQLGNLKDRNIRLNADTEGLQKAIDKLKELDRTQQRLVYNGAKAKVGGVGVPKPTPKPTAGSSAMGMMGGLKGAFMALGGFAIVNEIKATADAMMSLSSRIKTVTRDAAERLKIEQSLYALSQKNRASIEDIGDLYYKTALASKRFGATQQDVLRLTDIVSKSLIIGGADTAQQKSTILQLSQALGSGVLQGDELRSLRENAPVLMDAIATFFNTDVGGLKEMGAKGLLTTEKLMQAILSSGNAVDSQFGKITPTIGQAITVLGNKWSKLILDIQNSTGFFGQIAGLILQGVDLVGQAIDFVVEKFSTASPEMNAMLEDFKGLWESLQPLIKAIGTILMNWVIPALVAFAKNASSVLGMVATLLKPIADLLGRIADLIATASGGFGNLIAKAESGAIERYNNIVTNNQTNNVTVSSAKEAGTYVQESFPTMLPAD